MAALKLVIDSLDGIDDAVKALYVEDNGKFKLDVDGIEDTSGLKTALQKERGEREKLEKQVKRWQKLGKTEDEIAALVEERARAEEEKAAEAGQWDKLKAQMNEKHQADLQQADEKVSAMRKRLEAELIDAKAIAAIAAAKGVPELLLPHVQRHVKVDDNFNVQIVDAKGDPRVNGKGDPLTIPDLVEEMKQSETYSRAFDGAGMNGAGTGPNNTGGGAANRTPAGVPKSWAEAKTPEEKAAFIKHQKDSKG